MSPENLRDWLDAGGVAAGAAGELCPAAEIEAGRFDLIEARARRFADARRA